MVKLCVVYGCNSTAVKGIALHEFPKDDAGNGSNLFNEQEYGKANHERVIFVANIFARRPFQTICRLKWVLQRGWF